MQPTISAAATPAPRKPRASFKAVGASDTKSASKAKKVPKTLLLDLVIWEGRAHCVYLDCYRVAGGKPWGGGTTGYSWKVNVAQIQGILDRVQARGDTELSFEIFEHENGENAAYLDNTLLFEPRAGSRKARPRRVGSKVLMTKMTRLVDFRRAHVALEQPAAAQPAASLAAA